MRRLRPKKQDEKLQPAITILKNRSDTQQSIFFFSTDSLLFNFDIQTEILISSTVAEYRRTHLRSACVLFRSLFFRIAYSIPFEPTNTRLDRIIHRHFYCACTWWLGHVVAHIDVVMNNVHYICISLARASGLCRTDDRLRTSHTNLEPFSTQSGSVSFQKVFDPFSLHRIPRLVCKSTGFCL